jgi:hypothetical protein
MFIAKMNLEKNEYTKAAITPMQIAAQGSTASQPAVIATKPARIALQIDPPSNLCDFLKVL